MIHTRAHRDILRHGAFCATAYTQYDYLHKQTQCAIIDSAWGYLRKDREHAFDARKVLDTERGCRTLQGVRRNSKEAYQGETFSSCQIWQQLARFGERDTALSRQPARQKIRADSQPWKPEGVAVRRISAVGRRGDTRLRTTRHFVYIVQYLHQKVKSHSDAKVATM